MAELSATVLIDNIPAENLPGEWGLAIYITYRGKKILLDTGASGQFLKNAEAMGIDLTAVDFGVLSHAHSDHSDGMADFFEINKTAPFYLRQGTAENCYDKQIFSTSYIGICKGTLETYRQRIIFAEGEREISPGVWLLPHRTEGLARIGKRFRLYRREGRKWIPDDFNHEQSLVFETERGLVIFNSCSHGGADNIIREVSAAFPGRKIFAIIGGFHLFEATRGEVLSFARRVRDTGIEKAVTGHCTGQKAYDLLKSQLGDRLEQLHTGYFIEI